MFYLFSLQFWLTLVCRGLSIERVVTSFLKIHCVTSDPSSISLVLVINTTDQEEVGVILFSFAMHSSGMSSKAQQQLEAVPPLAPPPPTPSPQTVVLGDGVCAFPYPWDSPEAFDALVVLLGGSGGSPQIFCGVVQPES